MSPPKYYFWKILSTCTAPPKLTDRKVKKKKSHITNYNQITQKVGPRRWWVNCEEKKTKNSKQD